MITNIYKITCLTNMHVGNGDVNYSIIDNEVEKDSVTGYPMINASGLKGALRNYFVKEAKVDSKKVDIIFGKENAGTLRFNDAYMLARPARASRGEKAFYLITTDEALKKYNELAKIANKQEIEIKEYKGNERIENYEAYGKANYYNDSLYVLNSDNFNTIALPVIARNKLDNGESKNLWYEEMVPHETIMYFAVFVSDNDRQDLDDFTSVVNNKYVQIGGNATIGCGICKIELVGA